MTQPDPTAQGGGGGAQSGADSGNTDPNANNGAGAQSGGQPGDGGAGAGSGTGTQGMTLEQALAELERQRNRTAASDRNQATLQAELKKFQDAQLSEQDKAKRDLAEAQAAREKLEQEKRDLQTRIAFLSDTTYKWRNPEHALRLLDLSGVETKQDGSITGLKEAIKALAEGDGKYLLAPSDGGVEGGQGAPPPPAGSTVPMTGGQGGNGKGITADAARRFPALRTRGIGSN